jgi:hypothetical protein
MRARRGVVPLTDAPHQGDRSQMEIVTSRRMWATVKAPRRARAGRHNPQDSRPTAGRLDGEEST